MVTAAFIGPGTIATASQVGSRLGLTIGWALLFSLFATFVLQEIALRLGLVHRMGLAALLRRQLAGRWFGLPILGLVLLAIVFGNAAYQSGNLTGAAVGGSTLLEISVPVLVFGIAILAALVLWSGGYSRIERVLVSLVGLMALTFLITAVIAITQLQAPLSDWYAWAWPTGEETLLIALIGTTVVPYNLFLHASLVQQKWGPEIPLPVALTAARRDLLISTVIGGLVTLSVMVCAYAAFYGRDEPGTLSAFAAQLTPLLGAFSGICFGLGLLAAGLTSALTAPLAGSFVVAGVLGKDEDMTSNIFRGTWLTILVVGAVVAGFQAKPLTAILVAQYANGLVLPVMAMVLIGLANQVKVDADVDAFGDSTRQFAALVVVVFCLLLAVIKLV